MLTDFEVSSPEYLCQQQDSPVHDLRQEEEFGHSSHRYDVAEAINTLIQYGFSIGCDGELLPPRWLRVAR